MEHLLSWMIFFPAIGALVIALTPATKETLIKWIAAASTLVPLLLAIVLLRSYDSSSAQIQFQEQWDWIPSLNVQYFLGIDGISVLLVLLTAMLSFLGVFASWTTKKMVKGYFLMYMMLHVGMMGVFCSLDFFLFYIFWEVMLLPMYFLVGIWGGEKKEYAAIKFFLYTLAGSVLMLVGMLALYFYSRGPDGQGIPTFNILTLAKMDWTQYKIALFGWELPFDKTVWWLLFVGFAVKVPIFPFHTWLPWAHVQAPTAVSVILAGVLLKMGTYGLLRLNFTVLPQATESFAHVLAILGVINIIYGAFCAMAQKDLKKLVAYSSVSHMGYCLLGMSVFTPAGIQGAVLQMFNHGISAAMMFMLVGVLYDRLHHRYLVTPDGRLGFGGIAQKAPWLTAIWVVAVFASLGLPGLNGFISEALVFLGSFPVYKTLTIVAAAGIVLTAAYLLWMVQRVFLGPFTALHKDVETGVLHHAHDIPEVTAREWFVLVPLASLCLWIGVYPQPIINLIKVSLNQLIEVMH
ncbi:MAG: NADH-quinone oxidoreductase subunit M [Bdellovibrionales bacterium]|nr:NADH-quinone oxidoreductase subunit M [Bdellovibrionales bacterium]